MNIIMLGNISKEEIEERLRIVATAGNLSRADGTVTQVFDTNNDYATNLKLIKNIIGYGHKSITEHDYLTFALEDVTPIVEQTIIGYRLTSFTIKSRRNVDFRNVGFYVPTFKNKDGNVLSNNSDLQEIYKNYMYTLFDKYGKFSDSLIPIEDARYVLPYSFHSNIIMGCDANELLRITSDLLYGQNSKIDELYELGLKFKSLLDEYVPYLTKSLEKEKNKKYYGDKFEFLDEIVSDTSIETGKLLEEAKITNYTKNADFIVLCNILMNRYQISFEDAKEMLHQLSYSNFEIKKEMMDALLKSKNQRELEQVTYSFEMPISLAVLTHITRHRMHSLLVPTFAPLWNFDNYIIPHTIENNNEFKEEYENIFNNNKLMVEYFKEQGVRDEDLVYFYLSGNACNIYTTMNARTLEWISRMRTCNKAQWEIRELISKLVQDVKDINPLIGNCLGPTCTVEGYCPEGKDSCKNRGVVVKKLEKKNM